MNVFEIIYALRKSLIVAATLTVLFTLTIPVFAHEGEDHAADATTHVKKLETRFETTTTGADTWSKQITYAPGQAVSWRFYYKNIGNVAIQSIVAKTSLPDTHALVAGSVQWFDANHPAGYAFSDTALFSQGVSLGALPVNSDGYVRFRTVAKQGISCGVTKVLNGTVVYDGTTNAHSITHASSPCAPTPPTITPPAPVVQSSNVNSAPATPVTPTTSASASVSAPVTAQQVVSAPKVAGAVTSLPKTGASLSSIIVVFAMSYVGSLIYLKRTMLTKIQK